MNNDEKKYQDIPKTFFKPIEEVKEQQSELLKNYEQANNNNNKEPTELEKEVRALEYKLRHQSKSLSYLQVFIIVIIINVLWIIGVSVFIVPKYEKYVKESNEIKQNYDDLKSKVDAIVGE